MCKGAQKRRVWHCCQMFGTIMKIIRIKEFIYEWLIVTDTLWIKKNLILSAHNQLKRLYAKELFAIDSTSA